MEGQPRVDVLFQRSMVFGRNLHQLQRSGVRQRRHNALLCFVHALGRRQRALRGQPSAGPWQPTLLPARQHTGHDHADLCLCARRNPTYV